METDKQVRVSQNDFDRIERAGEGAAAEVWKASANRDLSFAAQGKLVALKLYKSDILDEPAQRERIAQEFKTGSRLVHPKLGQDFPCRYRIIFSLPRHGMV